MSHLIPRLDIFAASTERDILSELLADKRSANTKRAYERDLRDFFLSVTGVEPTPILVSQFLQMGRFDALALVARYKASLIERGLKEATVNRRLAALKSLANYARKHGKCEWSLEDVRGEKVKTYRDTSGVSRESFASIIAICDRSTPKGIRDYALLRLLWENALRRGEVEQCDVSDLDLESRRLWILGKGKGTQKLSVALSSQCCEALSYWLTQRSKFPTQSTALFISLDNHSPGQRLTGNGIYKIVSAIALKAGIKKQFSPHRVRHSSITAALELTGDVRKVQKLSRHAKLETLQIYDDNRAQGQSEVSSSLADLI